MSMQARRMMKETGTALAVLAIYVLTLLLPLHQAAGLQRDLNALGYSTIATWSVCGPLESHGHDGRDDAVPFKCPALGVAKHQLALTLPPAPALHMPLATGPVVLMAPATLIPSRRPDHVGQSRAPPAQA
jgi:hypothetical protein